MAKAILGRKVGMTQVFDENGKVIPVTAIEAGPCFVTQIKTMENDGYNALQVGYGAVKEKNVNKPLKGHFGKAEVEALKVLKEFRTEDVGDYEVGQKITADVFTEGDLVDATGTSKGKGFAGTIKRWNFTRGPMSHGSKNHRRPASVGAKGPARVFKGKKMPGRMGGNRVTVQNLNVVKIDLENNLILVKGAIPGAKKGLVILKNAVKAR